MISGFQLINGVNNLLAALLDELCPKKTCLQGFQPGQTPTNCFRRWLEACNFGFRKKTNCVIYEVKTKALIWAFVYAYAKSRFSHDAALILKIKSRIG